MKSNLIATLIFLLSAGSIFGQKTTNTNADTATITLIETTDRNVYNGLVVREVGDTLWLLTERLGVLSIPRNFIKSSAVVPKKRIVNGQYWYVNPHASQYFFQQSGYGLQKGEGSYDNAYLLYNQLNYGFTNHFSMGLNVIPLFFWDVASIVWLSPKFSIPIVDNLVNLGIGAYLGGTVGGYDYGYGNSSNVRFAIPFSNITLGSRDLNCTFGLGIARSSDNSHTTPVISFASMSRLGKKVSFISESYYIRVIEEQNGFVSAGFRFMGRHVGIDMSLVGVVSVYNGYHDKFVVPFIGFHLPLGRQPIK